MTVTKVWSVKEDKKEETYYDFSLVFVLWTETMRSPNWNRDSVATKTYTHRMHGMENQPKRHFNAKNDILSTEQTITGSIRAFRDMFSLNGPRFVASRIVCSSFDSLVIVCRIVIIHVICLLIVYRLHFIRCLLIVYRLSWTWVNAFDVGLCVSKCNDKKKYCNRCVLTSTTLIAPATRGDANKFGLCCGLRPSMNVLTCWWLSQCENFSEHILSCKRGVGYLD